MRQKTLTLVAFLCLLPCLAHAAPVLSCLERKDPLCVDEPFGTDKKLTSFLNKYHPPTGFISYAQLLKFYGYRFDVPQCVWDKNCADNSPGGSAFRIMKVDMGSIEDQVRLLVSQMQKGGCSYVTLSSPARSFQGNDLVIYSIDFNAAKRWCDNILGTYTLASVSGELLVFVRLIKDRVILSEQQSGINIKVDHTVNVQESKVLRFFNANGLIGQFLSVFIGTAQPVFRIFGSKIFDQPNFAFADAGNVIAAFVAEFNKRSQSYAGYTKFADGIIAPIYFLSVPETKFIALADGKLGLQLTGEAALNSNVSLYYHERKLNEIHMLSTLGEDDEMRMVKAGDTLWKYAVEKYGNGFFFNTILGWNYTLGGHLHPGDVVVLKPYYVIYGAVEGMVRPGDTLWSMWKRSRSGMTWREYVAACAPPGMRSPALIYPLQLACGI